MQKKVYAVRRGRTTGIFTAWAACRKQVDGFAGAQYKGFTDIADALKWLSGTNEAPQALPARSAAAPRARRTFSAAPAARAARDSAQDYVMYTDGSCLRNPDGPGGWACVIRENATGKVTQLSEGAPHTTNNRMELSAAIAALAFPAAPAKIALYTDSQYLKNGITKWMANWKWRGWKKADGTPVLNRDLWAQLDALCARHNVTFHWVKGHVGITLNERCDTLARTAAEAYL
ncbi:ribonuclease HI [Mitsuokella sp. oral taxon 131]|uniref:ribonuclease HI n=1 Tax=Mitsuokella sp. oral taxon 131 TaxID=1321780 RepID=UPI0003AD9AE9|nr:ribonuclease HI [Mitsuokella sp. oral taxon 131]ERL03570.1 ribonuclease HI [Mitsuokella sp. oral taxon 131 str. W9106]